VFKTDVYQKVRFTAKNLFLTSGRVESMTDSVDRFHFDRLTEENPTEVCRRAQCTYDTGKQCYILSVWGDDEFPSESKLLFDKSITAHLALDIIYALAQEVCGRVAKNQ
jgi:hypothetical protein